MIVFRSYNFVPLGTRMLLLFSVWDRQRRILLDSEKKVWWIKLIKSDEGLKGLESAHTFNGCMSIVGNDICFNLVVYY